MVRNVGICEAKASQVYFLFLKILMRIEELMKIVNYWQYFRNLFRDVHI